MKILNPRNLPESLVRAATGNPDREAEPLRFGVNELIGPPIARKLRLEHWGELSETVENRFWLMLGSAWHNYMEKYAPPMSVAEEKIEIPWKKYTIAGIPDLYYGDTLIDYKLTSVWSYIYGGKKEWEAQLNVYRWMIQTKHWVTISNLRIIAGFKDWRERDAQLNPDYPPAQILEIVVPTWTHEDTERYIESRIAAHENLTPCTPEERYHKADTWAVMKKGRKSAMRVLDSQNDAMLWMSAKAENGTFIEHRLGEDKKCKSYCSVRDFCPNNIHLNKGDMSDE